MFSKAPLDCKYDEKDLDELCLWLYGIYEETELELE